MNESKSPLEASKWDDGAISKFRQMLDRMPIFARPMAEKPVSRKAEEMARQANELQVTDQHLIAAFFEVTPFGFHGPMMTDMEAVGLDYRKYGYPLDYSKQ